MTGLILSLVLFDLAASGQMTLTTQADNTTCGGSNGVIYVQITGGTAPYSLSDNGGPAQASALFTKVPAGVHNIRVTDARGVAASISVTLTNNFIGPTLPRGSVTSTRPTACDAYDGTITALPAGGTPAYTYSLNGSPARPANTFTGLPAGSYSLTVRDQNGCGAAMNLVLKGLCPVVVTFTNNKPTICQNDGSITISNVTGGTPPYQYSLDGTNYTTNPADGRFSNMSPAPYTLYVKDAAGTVVINTFQIKYNCGIPMTATTTPSRCADNDGTITITATGGRAPLFYSIDARDFQESNVVRNVAPGAHTLHVKDANGSLGDAGPVTVGRFCPVLTLRTTPTACTTNTGTITVTSTNGAPPVNFSINGSAFTAATTFPNLAAGNYTVVSRDANRDTTSATVTVTTVNGPTLRAVSTDAGCTVSNGTITATATGGAPAYTYQFDTATAVQTSGNFPRLAAGTYTVKVSDVNGCSDLATTVVNTAASPAVTVATTEAGCTVKNGTLTATASGGLSPYMYRLDSAAPQNTGSFRGLASGNYAVTITDANGCRTPQSAVVPGAAGPTLTLANTTTTCAGNDGTITVTGNAGRAPYTYSLDGGGAQNNNRFTGVDTGDHAVKITDANGCSATANITVDFVNDITVDAGNDVPVCAGSSVTLRGTASAPATWVADPTLSDPAVLTPVATPAQTTTYRLTAKTGVCSRSDEVQVRVEPLPFANAGNDTTVCFGQTFRLNGSGGQTYSWTPSDNLDNDHVRNPTVGPVEQTTTYRLSVTDQNGCVSKVPDPVLITVSPAPYVNAGNDTSVLTGIPVQLQATDPRQNGFIRYEWTPGAGLSNPNLPNPVATLSTNTIFLLHAYTAAGCIATDTLKIKVFQVANLYVPNAFTPNGDGHNDVLRVLPIGIRDFRYFAIFNRAGQRVFTTKNAGDGWDGRMGGQNQPSAGYVWVAEGIDYEGNLMKRSGSVLLIR